MQEKSYLKRLGHHFLIGNIHFISEILLFLDTEFAEAEARYSFFLGHLSDLFLSIVLGSFISLESKQFSFNPNNSYFMAASFQMSVKKFCILYDTEFVQCTLARYNKCCCNSKMFMVFCPVKSCTVCPNLAYFSI